MGKKLFYLNLLFLTITPNYLFGDFPQKMVICVPVADLRKEPVKAIPNIPYPILSKDNPLQDSQLLMGEYIFAFQKKTDIKTGNKWLKIYTLEQTTFKNGAWFYKEGWIQRSQATEVKEFPCHNLVVKQNWTNVFKEPDSNTKAIEYLSIGTKLFGQKLNTTWYKILLPIEGYIEAKDIYYVKPEVIESEALLRKQIYNVAFNFFDTPYSWGGRSGYNQLLSSQVIGVDCSGFINLTYRAVGLEIPRDAHDQFLACQKIDSGKNLKVGDLIFFASKENPKKIIHVAMYVIEEIHGPMLMESVGEWPYKNILMPDTYRLGEKFENIENGKQYGNYFIYLGSFLNDPNLVAQLRAKALKNDFKEFRGLDLQITSTGQMGPIKTSFAKI